MKWNQTVFSVAVVLPAFLPGMSAASILSVRTDDCSQLVYHVPDGDVAYVPGVDVNGNAVVPADLGGGYGITAPDEVNIDIRLDLAERLGLGGDDFSSGASALLGGEGVVGRVTVRGNDIYWNDVKLARDSYAALAAACGEAFTSAGIPLPLPKPDVTFD